MRRSLSISTVFPKYHPRAGQPTGFEAAIFHHKKLHTIRSGNRWRAGDTARVFTWTGAPYRSKQRVIIPELPIVKVYDIVLAHRVWINGLFYGDFDYGAQYVRLIAENDGLAPIDFVDWFRPYLPFYGQIICWGNVDY